MPGGWGTETIIFSKPEEHNIVADCTLTTIPKLEKQWRITHDFKPMAYNSGGSWRCTLRLEKGYDQVMNFCFKETDTMINCVSQHWLNARYSSTDLPQIGEWTTIDVTNEELEPGKCTLTIFFGEKQVFQEEKEGARALTNVCVTATSSPQHVQNGFIRRLTIMTKK